MTDERLDSFADLAQGICMPIVHHVKAAVHVDSDRRPL